MHKTRVCEKHGHQISTCRCWAKNKQIAKVPCSERCPDFKPAQD